MKKKTQLIGIIGTIKHVHFSLAPPALEQQVFIVLFLKDIVGIVIAIVAI